MVKCRHGRYGDCEPHGLHDAEDLIDQFTNAPGDIKETWRRTNALRMALNNHLSLLGYVTRKVEEESLHRSLEQIKAGEGIRFDNDEDFRAALDE